MTEQKQQYPTIHIVVECALMVALGTVLAMIKFSSLPQGGSVTAASMVPFLIVSYRHGVKWGLLSGFVNALLQMLLGGIYPPVAPGVTGYVAEILLDYLLAYMVVGLAHVFYKPFKNLNKMLGIGVSAFICCLLRFICAFVSGFLVWADLASDGIGAVTYSLSYNAGYMIPETIITVAVACLLYKFAPKLFTSQ